MMLSTIETDTLPKDQVMVWNGIIMPNMHLVTWFLVKKEGIVLQEHRATQEDFDRIPQDEWVIKSQLEAIRKECFPCRCCFLDLRNGFTKLIMMIPESEIQRVGLEEKAVG